MNINRLFEEIWAANTYWELKCDEVRGIHMYKTDTGIAIYGDTVEDVARKVWLLIYRKEDIEVFPHSYGMVRG